jgi:hypothetical protein
MTKHDCSSASSLPYLRCTPIMLDPRLAVEAVSVQKVLESEVRSALQDANLH